MNHKKMNEMNLNISVMNTLMNNELFNEQEICF